MSCGILLVSVFVLEDRLHLLFENIGIINMINIANRYGKIHLFVVHNVFEPHIINNLLGYKVKSGDLGGGGMENGNEVESVNMDDAEVARGNEGGVQSKVENGNVGDVEWKGKMREGFRVRLH